MKSEKPCYFDIAKRMLFLAANTEGTAETLGYHESANIVFKRTSEFLLELTETIENTLNAGLVRPAYSLLRTSLDLCTAFSWLAQDFENRLDRFESGRCPSAQKMMSSANLCWEEEYINSYKPLSDFVHGSFTLSDVNKEIRTYEIDDDIPNSISSDYFIALDEARSKIIHIDDKPKDELSREHRPYIEIKTFDLVLTMLMRASGEYSDSFNWWPGREKIEEFNSIVKNSERSHHFLWPKEKKFLAIYRVEGRYA